MQLSEEQKACLWLAHAKMTSRNASLLFEKYKNAATVFHEFPNLMPGLISNKMRELLVDSKKDLNKNIDSLYKNEVNLLSQCDNNYPEKLSYLEYKPYAIFYKGNLDIFNKASVGIVGTRKPSAYGRRVTKEFANIIGQYNLSVVSGMALGIDSYAHEGAYNTIGGTIAVCGCGLAIDYPVSNRELKQNIINNNGILISEYDCDTPAVDFHFPYRNRIIAALSDVLVFVEGKQKSGGMITVKYAHEQGKQVYAIPGNIDAELSEGPNKLIAMAEAKCASSVDDVLEAMKISQTEKQANIAEKDKNKIEQNLYGLQLEIYKALRLSSRSFDEIVDLIKTTPDKVQSAIAFLELLGYIRRAGGNHYEIDKGVN